MDDATAATAATPTTPATPTASFMTAHAVAPGTPRDNSGSVNPRPASPAVQSAALDPTHYLAVVAGGDGDGKDDGHGDPGIVGNPIVTHMASTTAQQTLQSIPRSATGSQSSLGEEAEEDADLSALPPVSPDVALAVASHAAEALQTKALIDALIPTQTDKALSGMPAASAPSTSSPTDGVVDAIAPPSTSSLPSLSSPPWATARGATHLTNLVTETAAILGEPALAGYHGIASLPPAPAAKREDQLAADGFEDVRDDDDLLSLGDAGSAEDKAGDDNDTGDGRDLSFHDVVEDLLEDAVQQDDINTTSALAAEASGQAPLLQSVDHDAVVAAAAAHHSTTASDAGDVAVEYGSVASSSPASAAAATTATAKSRPRQPTVSTDLPDTFTTPIVSKAQLAHPRSKASFVSPSHTNTDGKSKRATSEPSGPSQSRGKASAIPVVTAADMEPPVVTSASYRAPSSWLLRLFEWEHFGMLWILRYLNDSKHFNSPGVQYYLCDKLRSCSDDAIDFCLPQLCRMAAMRTSQNAALEEFILGRCRDKPHMALKTLWFLQAFLNDTPPAQKIKVPYILGQRLVRALQIQMFSNTRPSSGNEHRRLVEGADAGPRMRHNAAPAMVGMAAMMASIVAPALMAPATQLALKEGARWHPRLWAMQDVDPGRPKSATVKPPLSKSESMPMLSDGLRRHGAGGAVSSTIGVTSASVAATDSPSYAHAVRTPSATPNPTPRIPSKPPSPPLPSHLGGQLFEDDPDLWQQHLHERVMTRIPTDPPPLHIMHAGKAFSFAWFLRDAVGMMHVDPDASDATLLALYPEHQRAFFFHAAMSFNMALIEISDRLRTFDKPSRQVALRHELELLNHNLPARVCMPMWCRREASTDATGVEEHQHLWVARVVTSEAVVLNSADRTPYLLLVEVIAELPREVPSEPYVASPVSVTGPASPAPAVNRKTNLLANSAIGHSDSMPNLHILTQIAPGVQAPSKASSAQRAQTLSPGAGPLSAGPVSATHSLNALGAADRDPATALGNSATKTIHDTLTAKIRTAVVMLAQLYHEQHRELLAEARAAAVPKRGHAAATSNGTAAGGGGNSSGGSGSGGGSGGPNSGPSDAHGRPHPTGKGSIDLDRPTPRPMNGRASISGAHPMLSQSAPPSPMSKRHRFLISFETIRARVLKEMMAFEQERLALQEQAAAEAAVARAGEGGGAVAGPLGHDTMSPMSMSDPLAHARPSTEVPLTATTETSTGTAARAATAPADDPSASVLSEDFAGKQERLRLVSPYGHCRGWQIKSVIVKSGADLRQEQFALQLIQEMQRWWQEHDSPAWVHAFKILVISDQSGLVETITNSVSVHSLKKKGVAPPGSPKSSEGLPATLLDVFKERYGNPKSRRFREAQDNFSRSLVGYSIVSYLLQLKDRHNGNILLTKEGSLVHIDFGFMLSNSPGSLGMELAPFKLTQEYIDILGGIHSEAFARFRRRFKKAFADLRNKRDEIVALVQIMERESTLPCFTGAASKPSAVAAATQFQQHPLALDADQALARGAADAGADASGGARGAVGTSIGTSNDSARPNADAFPVAAALCDRFHRDTPNVDDVLDGLIDGACNSTFTLLYDTFQYYTNGIV